MTTKNKPHAWARRAGIGRTPLVRIREQMQIRATAVKSPAFNPTVKAALDRWSQDIDQMAALVNEVEVGAAEPEEAFG